MKPTANQQACMLALRLRRCFWTIFVLLPSLWFQSSVGLTSPCSAPPTASCFSINLFLKSRNHSSCLPACADSFDVCGQCISALREFGVNYAEPPFYVHVPISSMPLPGSGPSGDDGRDLTRSASVIFPAPMPFCFVPTAWVFLLDLSRWVLGLQ